MCSIINPSLLKYHIYVGCLGINRLWIFSVSFLCSRVNIYPECQTRVYGYVGDGVKGLVAAEGFTDVPDDSVCIGG